jgi:hypothetical protein
MSYALLREVKVKCNYCQGDIWGCLFVGGDYEPRLYMNLEPHKCADCEDGALGYGADSRTLKGLKDWLKRVNRTWLEGFPCTNT